MSDTHKRNETGEVSSSSTHESERAGHLFNQKYKVVALLGRGGMGTVYRVVHVLLNKEYALKTIDSQTISATSVRRFQSEAQTASALLHPNLVTVHDMGVLEDGRPFLVMDFVKGVTLADHLKNNGPMPVKLASRLFAQVCFGLLSAHERGIVHRDIKPGNIMLVDDADLGSEGSVKIVDFGIAKLFDSDGSSVQSLTATGELIGSPLYMSPEQCSCESVDQRSDIYSLGCVMFEALTGAPPHVGATALKTMLLHQSGDAPSLREASLGRQFPEEMEAIVARMLSKSPQQRYQNAGLVALDLGLVITNDTTGGPAPTVTAARKPAENIVRIRLRSLVLLLSLAVTLAAVGGALGAYFFLTDRKSTLTKTLKNRATTQVAASTSDRLETGSSERGLLSGFEEKPDRKLSKDAVNMMGSDMQLNFPVAEIGSIVDLSDNSKKRAQGVVKLASNARVELDLDASRLQAEQDLARLDKNAFVCLNISGHHIAASEPVETKNLHSALRVAATWNNLQSLNAHDIAVDRQAVAEINNLSELKYLSIDGISNASDLKLLTVFNRLEFAFIYLQNGDFIRVLPPSESIKLLGLIAPNLRSADILTLTKYSNLRTLRLSSERISDEVATSIARLKNLHEVYIQKASDRQIEILSRCGNITKITLSISKSNAADQLRIKSKFPKVSFVSEE